MVGTLLLLGGNGGVVLSELFIPTGVAAVVIATVPIWLNVFDAMITRRRPGGLVIGGLVAGLVGVAVLFVPAEGFGQLNPIGIGLCLGGAISWAIGSLYARHHPLPRSALLGTGMEMLIGGMALFVGGVLLGELGRTDVTSFSMNSIVAVLYLVVFGSIAGYSAYTWLLANVSVSTVATYAYVNPIVAVALGALFLAEPITPRTLIAAVLIIGAVVAMVSGRPRTGRGATTPDRGRHRARPGLTDGTDPAAARAMTEPIVSCLPAESGWHCTVTLGDDAGATTHEVTVDREVLEDLAPGATPEELVRVSFEFLLEREPRESIMRQFELPIIGRFFSDYRDEMLRRLAP